MSRSVQLISSLLNPDELWLSHAQLTHIANFLHSHAGLVFGKDKHKWLTTVVSQFVKTHGIGSCDALIANLEADATLRQSFINEFTINESFLFRDRPLLESFTKHLLVPRMQRPEPAHIWSAAAATGDEPVTLALLCAETQARIGGDWVIHASDIDTEALETAKRGVFDRRKVKDVPASLLQRHFTPSVYGWQVKPEISGKIHYFHHNLISEGLPDLPGPMDFIFLRNVMIYFDRATRTSVVARAHDLLAEDGVLCLGHAESLPDDHPFFDKEALDQVVFHRKKTK